MIKSLRLEKFGRFNETTFNFAPVTLFYGPNEAGKTTLFDALFNAISSPKGNTIWAKVLTERYGKDRKAVPEYSGAPLSIAEADFMNLFAIRSGEINLEIAQNSQWMSQVKASLFSGGIDPEAVAAKLDRDIKSSAKGTLGGEEKTINAELAKIENDKMEAEKIRQGCLAEEKRIADTESQMKEDEAEISRLTAEIKNQEESLNQQKLLRNEESLDELLTSAKSLQRIKDKQEKYEHLSKAGLEELREREGYALKREAEAGKAAAQEEVAIGARNGIAKEKELREAEKLRKDAERNLAEFLRVRLAPRDKLVSRKNRLTWRWPLLAAAGLLIAAAIAAAIAAFLLFPNGLIIALVTLAAAIVCAALSPKRETWEDPALLDAAMLDAREQWKKETGEDPGSRYDEILDTLSRASERSRAASDAFDEILAKRARQEDEAANYALQKKQADDAAKNARLELGALLAKAETASIEEYNAHLQLKENIDREYAQLNAKLQNAIRDNNASSITELEDILNRKKDELSRRITAERLQDSEIRKMENRLEQDKNRLSELSGKHNKNIGYHSVNLGTIRGRLKGIPEKIVDCGKEIQKRAGRLAEIKKEKRAMEIAQELFASLSEDSSQTLEQLSSEIGGRFSELINAKRTVNFKRFSPDEASIGDAAGSGRNKELLSAGTRDAFLLAARLVLAEKSMSPEGSAIIVLDEPFLTLDRPRTDRALAILEKFHRDTNMQIVIFTKDEETERQARTIFGEDLCVNKL